MSFAPTRPSSLVARHQEISSMFAKLHLLRYSQADAYYHSSAFSRPCHLIVIISLTLITLIRSARRKNERKRALRGRASHARNARAAANRLILDIRAHLSLAC